ncbi:MAG: hypothetical protein O2848_01285, partial [Proteobacteria bacterium]|nr:hypothetical protein [Pseudomonadota bacterium]
KRLEASGLTRQFLQQSGYGGVDPDRPLRLRFQVPLDTLSEPGLITRVTKLLSDALGERIQLDVAVREPAAPTAAAKAAARAEELQRRAEQSIAESALVQALIREFDGTIVPGSIRWDGPDPDDMPSSSPPSPPSSPNQESSS